MGILIELKEINHLLQIIIQNQEQIIKYHKTKLSATNTTDTKLITHTIKLSQ